MKRWSTRFAVLFPLTALAAFLLSTSLNDASAEPAPAPAPQAPAKQPKDYAVGDVHLEQSRVYIHVDKTGLGHIHGVAGILKQGRMALDDPKQPGALVFDMTSFVADVPYARKFFNLEGDKSVSTQREVTETMRGPEVLDVQKFPTAEYVIGAIRKLEQPSRQGFAQYQVDGKLTLHGVTRPVKFVAEAEPQGDWVHVRGKFSMLQSQFGITPLTKAFGAIGVQDELIVAGDLWVAAKAMRQ